MKRSILIFAAALACLATPGSSQENPNVEQVLRREDKRGIIILFTTPLENAASPQDVSGFVVLNVSTQTAVPIQTSSVVRPEQCPQFTTVVRGRAVGPRDRLCLELKPEAGQLDDQQSYVVFTDIIRLLQPARAVPPTLLRIPPVAGAIAPIKEETSRIVATFSRELAGDATVRPVVKVNGRPMDIVDADQTPPCYNVGSLSFQCTLRRPVQNGDVVEFELVRPTGEPAGYGSFEKTTVAATLPEKADQIKNFLISVALSRLNDESNGTLTVKTAEGGLARQIGRVGGQAFLELAPYADILVTSKTDGSGRLSAGPQVRLNTFAVPGINLATVQATPRFEADDKNVRHNWMYLDTEVVLYIQPLYRGTFLGAARQIFPRVGYERGTTGRGSDSVAVERNNPSRWTAGASLVLHWAEGTIPLFPAGVDVTADYDRLWIERNEEYVNPPTATPAYWSASATLRVAKNFGITATRRSGRRPPLFKFHSALEVGASFLY